MSDIRLQMGNADIDEVSEVTFKVLSSIQQATPGVQVASIGCLLSLLEERLNIRSYDIYNIGSNIIHFSDKNIGRHQFEAIREYIDNEL